MKAGGTDGITEGYTLGHEALAAAKKRKELSEEECEPRFDSPAQPGHERLTQRRAGTSASAWCWTDCTRRWRERTGKRTACGRTARAESTSWCRWRQRWRLAGRSWRVARPRSPGRSATCQRCALSALSGPCVRLTRRTRSAQVQQQTDTLSHTLVELESREQLLKVAVPARARRHTRRSRDARAGAS